MSQPTNKPTEVKTVRGGEVFKKTPEERKAKKEQEEKQKKEDFLKGLKEKFGGKKSDWFR